MIGRFLRALWRGITMLRLALANILFLLVLLALWLVLRGGTPTPLPERAALLIDPQGQIVDQARAVDPVALLVGEGAELDVELSDLIDAVDYARDDERITALVLELDGILYIGHSKALELAAAIARFRDSGKPVVAVGDYFSQDQYRLAVEADQVLIHPLGGVALEGYAAYLNYFAEALEKLSITVHVFRAGDQKSAAEPFQRRDMSEEEKVITQRWLDQLWGLYTDGVEKRRGLEPGALDALIDGYPERLRAAGRNAATLALESGLVDRLVNRRERAEYLADLVGARDDDGNYEAIRYGRYLQRMRPARLDEDRPHIAVVTAEGNMLPGEQEAGNIGGDSLAARLRDASERAGVAAIVLRVNSGGGSVFAAEIIREEIARIRAEGMPVVVSMGAVAASGGYYVAAEADRIYATPATLTGSIGVIAVFPTAERLLARGGIYTDGVGTTSVAGGLRPDRALNPLVAETVQLSVDQVHEDFIATVANGRALPREAVLPIADGRAITALEALERGLIDALGGLEDAVAGAAEIAGVEDYQLIEVGPPLSPRQFLLQRVTAATGMDVPRAESPVARTLPWLASLRATAELLNSLADPRHLYMRCLNCGG